MPRSKKLKRIDQRPLRVMFLITSMPVGGAETLLVNLVRRLDSKRFEPQICCLKNPGPLGKLISEELPVHTNFISHKFDFAVVNRLRRLFLNQRIDALVTVGAGDKMFWGRLAARRAKLPVILSALHSTGWPDGVGRLNRMLTRFTDGFIAVAKQHGSFLIETEKFPADRVFVIPNGVDTDHFVFDGEYRKRLREELGIDAAMPVVTIVAALRPEKNHNLFLAAARRVLTKRHDAQFLVVGDGPLRETLEQTADRSGLAGNVRFLGSRSDIAAILSASDIFALTSKNEASPVSILESMSCGLPIVAPNIGSISELVINGKTGILFEGEDPEEIGDHWLSLLNDRDVCGKLGAMARAHVTQHSSLEMMAEGYSSLIETIYSSKNPGSTLPAIPTVSMEQQSSMPESPIA